MSLVLRVETDSVERLENAHKLVDLIMSQAMVFDVKSMNVLRVYPARSTFIDLKSKNMA